MLDEGGEGACWIEGEGVCLVIGIKMVMKINGIRLLCCMDIESHTTHVWEEDGDGIEDNELGLDYQIVIRVYIDSDSHLCNVKCENVYVSD